MKKKFIVISLLSLTYLFPAFTHAQTKKISATVWDGMIVAGYVNNGAYANLGGPAIKLIKKPCSVGIGMLPTLRIKEDKVPAGAKKNAIVTPTLGFGLTMTYKHLAVQMPFYYNSKSAVANGKWNVGIGVGYKF